jgi:tetratricopeptide (TPR) repeat protein
MHDTGLSRVPQRRQGRGNALTVALGAIVILAVAAAVYFWREQRSAAFQRDAAHAQAAQAERHFKEASEMIEAVIAGLADNLAGTIGIKAEDAYAVFVKIEAAIDKFVAQTDYDPGIRRNQGVMYLQFADTYLRLGNFQLAVDSARKGTRIFSALAEQRPNDNELQSNIGLGLEKIGEALGASGDVNGSRAAYRESLEVARAVSAKDPGNVQWRTDIVLSLWRLAAAGDEPRERLIGALKILRLLKLEGALSPDQEQWIAAIERDITNLN